MNKRRALAVAAMAVGLSGQASPPRYAEGQVWEYRTRPGESGSRLKIQKVETSPAALGAEPIYHISVIGFRLRNPRIAPLLPHAPVTRETLDKSVTRLSAGAPVFPGAEEGIAEWRRARGGVYTIGVAAIIDTLDRQLAGATE